MKIQRLCTYHNILQKVDKGDILHEDGPKTTAVRHLLVLSRSLVSGIFQFDLRVRKSGIRIDSSSFHGAFILKDGERKTFENSDAKWKWENGTSKFETSYHGLVRDRRPIISVKTC